MVMTYTIDRAVRGMDRPLRSTLSCGTNLDENLTAGPRLGFTGLGIVVCERPKLRPVGAVILWSGTGVSRHTSEGPT